MSYAVLWSDALCDPEIGKLELERESFRFEGARIHRVYYEDIENVRIAHHTRERLRGRPAVVVDLLGGGSLRIGSVNGVGTVAELADELTKLSAR
jgi:hypothetical protein